MEFVLKTMWRWLWGQCGGGYGVNVEVAMGRQTDLVLYASSRSIKIWTQKNLDPKNFLPQKIFTPKNFDLQKF